MSKNIDDVIREVMKSNKEIHNMDNHLTKDITEVKKSIKNIENKIKTLENKIDQAIDILNTFTILISDMDDMNDVDIDDEEENEDWTPYDQAEDYQSDYDADSDEDQY
jgi:predicted  nucleic acid-binding Zn-ribbon protein